MTYSKSLQGRFVATGYPAAGMLFVSILLWGLGALSGVGACDSLSALVFLGNLPSRLLSLMLYAVVAFVLVRLYVLERRAQWIFSLFMWFPAVFISVQPCCTLALSVLLLLFSVAQLLLCVADRGQERTVFGAFALLSFSSLLFVQFALLLPLFLGYMLISRVTGVRNFMAALLGAITPYWLLFGAMYIYPSFAALSLPLKASISSISSFAGFSFSPAFYLWLAVEVVVWVVATYIYVSTFYPAKPLLRRRFLFFILLNAYLALLTFVIPQNYLMLLVWRMPGMAIMVSYLFAMKVTRLSNIFFILINAAWLLIAFICLWTG